MITRTAKHDSWLPVRTSKDVVVADAAAAAEGLLGGRRKSIFDNGVMRRGSFALRRRNSWKPVRTAGTLTVPSAILPSLFFLSFKRST